MPRTKSVPQPVIRPAVVSEEQPSAQDLAFPSVRLKRQYGIKCLKQVATLPYKRMLELIRMGCYDHVAAASLGITPHTFLKWLKQGAEGYSPATRKFYLDVMEARNQARALAEIEVKKLDPKFWLTRGPGKHSLAVEEITDDGQMEHTVLPGWEDVQHLEVSGSPSPFNPGFAPTESPTQLPTVTPLQEFAASLQLMEELGILKLTDSFRAASATPAPSTPIPDSVGIPVATFPVLPPPAIPATTPSSATVDNP